MNLKVEQQPEKKTSRGQYRKKYPGKYRKEQESSESIIHVTKFSLGEDRNNTAE